MKPDIFNAMAGLLAIVAMLAMIGHIYQLETSKPRLVGYDCAGSGGPLFANHESDFPPCAVIEKYK